MHPARKWQALEILNFYKGKIPLSQYLKEHFKKNSKYGKRDRQELSDFMFSYFRLKGLFPLHGEEDFLELLFEKGEDNLLQSSINDDYFPLNDIISPEIEKESFIRSHFEKLPFYAPILKHKKDFIIKELSDLEIQFNFVEDDVLCLNHSDKLTQTESFKQGFCWVQDLSTYLSIKDNLSPQNGEVWWDVCAGGGGKSLALLNQNRDIKLYITDDRKNVLQNAQERISKSFSVIPKEIKIDVFSHSPREIPMVDGLIMDLPCTGSGTWARTPEMLHFFDEDTLYDVIQLQKGLINNAIPKLKTGKTGIFITCSVYQLENEKQISWMAENHPIEIQKSFYYKGYESKSENIFVTTFKKK